MCLLIGLLECSGGPPSSLLAHIFVKIRFFRVKTYISLCAFEINEDGADKLSFAPPPLLECLRI